MPDETTTERIVSVLAEKTQIGEIEWESVGQYEWQATKGTGKFTVSGTGTLTFEQEGEKHAIGQTNQDTVRTFKELVGRIRQKEQEKRDRAYRNILQRALDCLENQ